MINSTYPTFLMSSTTVPGTKFSPVKMTLQYLFSPLDYGVQTISTSKRQAVFFAKQFPEILTFCLKIQQYPHFLLWPLWITACRYFFFVVFINHINIEFSYTYSEIVCSPENFSDDSRILKRRSSILYMVTDTYHYR